VRETGDLVAERVLCGSLIEMNVAVMIIIAHLHIVHAVGVEVPQDGQSH
jgi:hypothetical protein